MKNNGIVFQMNEEQLEQLATLINKDLQEMAIGAYTKLDCGCKAIEFTEQDGTGYVDIEQCKMHKAAPEMLAALIDAHWLIHTAVGQMTQKQLDKLPDDFETRRQAGEQAIANASRANRARGLE